MASAVHVYLSVLQNILEDSADVVEFDTKIYDILGEFDTSTYKFTATVAGKYLVCFQVVFGVGAADDTLEVSLEVNGTTVAEIDCSAPTAGLQTVNGTKALDLDVGDYIQLRVENKDNADQLAGNTRRHNYMTITQVQADGGAGSAVSVYPLANQSIASGVAEIVEFNREDYDALGEFDTATYTFTATLAGKYAVSFAAKFGSGIGETCVVDLQKNSTSVAKIIQDKPTAGVHSIVGSITLDLDIGDTIHLEVENSDANDTVFAAANEDTFMTITQVQ